MAIEIVEKHHNARTYYKDLFQEILIDEYQDTSDLQELFISYISSNNVYMVGDIKQSIYRFRNANPNLFKEKYEAYSNNNGGIKIDLNKNFRSREEVLNNINLIFNLIMDDNLGGANYQQNGQMIFGNNVYNNSGKNLEDHNLEILNYNIDTENKYSKNEIEIFAIADDIKKKVLQKYQVFDKDLNALRDCNYSDFAVILDRATDFTLYKKIFEYLNIPLNVLKEESISESMDLKIIKNIIRLVIKTHNKVFDSEFWYSWISVSRSYLFNLTDQEIFDRYVKKDYKNSELFNLVNKISKGIHDNTIYGILNDIILDFNFYQKIVLVGNIDSHLAILDYLLDFASGIDNIYTLQEFYDFLENITIGNLDISFNASNDHNSGVKLMTIHKSKGLEFPICYYAGLYKLFNISDLKEKFIFDKKYGFIIPAAYNDGLKSIITKDLLIADYLKEEISEKIRLFYVALTRSKEKMIFVTNLKEIEDFYHGLIPLRNRLQYRSFMSIIESIKNYLTKYIKIPEMPNGLTKDYNLTISKKGEDIALGKRIIAENSVVNAKIVENKKYSKNMHTILSAVDKKKINDGLVLHNIMENLDLIKPNYSDVPSQYLEYVKSFIDSGVLKGMINYYQEYEFCFKTQEGNYHGIIDLIIEYDDHILIVDYKLKNTFDEAYKKQLIGYKNYISGLTNKRVDLTLYSLIEKRFDEVDINGV